MSSETPIQSGPPAPTSADTQARRVGIQMVGASVVIACLLTVIAVLGLTVFRQVHIIDALVTGVSQQRDQFQACKGKPSTAAGCTTPVAAEPSVIVKQGSRGPAGLAGGMGPVGPQGPQGPQGPAGPPGAVGRPGLPGSSPACLLEPSRCIGATGADGKPGKDGSDGLPGRDGKDGADGLPGKDGKDGAQGEMGVQGPPGRGIAKTACVNGKWVITYSDGAQEEPQGSCETAGP